jgi:predicted NBD/HSP70 family sugar kinase
MKIASTNSIKMIDVHDVRDINQTIFLHLIRERQPISRAEIAKFMGLRAGTVSAIVNRLIKNNFVYEGTEGPSSGGRRPMNLYINAENFYVLAVDIGVSDTVFAISDFNGLVLRQTSIPTDGKPHDFLNTLADKIQAMITANYSSSRFGAVGVSVPGLVNRENGTVEVSPNLEWQDVPVRKILSERLGLPVLVENDANAAAFSELLYGPLTEAKVRTLLFVLVVEGLGTGLIINGELHVGSRHGLGGFGHMSIDPNGELCSCGRRGCWETFASERATVDRFRRLTAKHEMRISNLNDLIDLARKGDELALQSLKITGEYLGEGISNLAHGLLPETVVIGGDIADAWEIIGPVIKDKLRSRYIISPDSIAVRPASVRRPSLFGAITIALQNCYPSNQNSLRSL